MLAPIDPAAPLLFSMITPWPHLAPSFWATMRAPVSVPPPGGNGTIRVTGRVGYAPCADTAPVTDSSIAAKRLLFMGISVEWEGGFESGLRQDDAFDFANDEQVAADRDQRVGGDEDQCGAERTRALDEVADDDRRGDRGSVAEGVEQGAAQPCDFLRRGVRHDGPAECT